MNSGPVNAEAATLQAGATVWIAAGDPSEDSPQAAAEVLHQDGEELVVSAPDFAAAYAVPAVGSAVILRWTNERGVYACAATLTAVTDTVPRRWHLLPTAGVARKQRRDYARASFSGPVLIVPMGSGPVAVVKGEMSDLSEAGLRAQLGGSALPAGTPVEAHLVLDATPVALQGCVLRCDLVDPQTGRHEIVVTFAVPEDSAARLRRVVLRQQMQERRERLQ